jgi:hypothetical protein
LEIFFGTFGGSSNEPVLETQNLPTIPGAPLVTDMIRLLLEYVASLEKRKSDVIISALNYKVTSWLSEFKLQKIS